MPMDDTAIRPDPLRARPLSPCVNICTLDDAEVCTGCMRTLDEIADWATLTPEAQWRIVGELPRRAASSAGAEG